MSRRRVYWKGLPSWSKPGVRGFGGKMIFDKFVMDGRSLTNWFHLDVWCMAQRKWRTIYWTMWLTSKAVRKTWKLDAKCWTVVHSSVSLLNSMIRLDKELHDNNEFIYWKNTKEYIIIKNTTKRRNCRLFIGCMAFFYTSWTNNECTNLFKL